MDVFPTNDGGNVGVERGQYDKVILQLGQYEDGRVSHTQQAHLDPDEALRLAAMIVSAANTLKETNT